MSVKVYWNEPARSILRIEFGEVVRPGDLSATTRKARRMIARYPVDVVYSFPFALARPLGEFWLPFQQVVAELPPNVGIIVAVGGPTFAETMQAVFGRSLRKIGNRVMLVNSLDEALSLLTGVPAGTPEELANSYAETGRGGGLRPLRPPFNLGFDSTLGRA